MDFTSVLFLPLLGGYLFFTHFNATRYAASAFPVQRLIFPSASYGLAFLLIALALRLLVRMAAIHPNVWKPAILNGVLVGVGFSCFAASLFVYRRTRASLQTVSEA